MTIITWGSIEKAQNSVKAQMSVPPSTTSKILLRVVFSFIFLSSRLFFYLVLFLLQV